MLSLENVCFEDKPNNFDSLIDSLGKSTCCWLTLGSVRLSSSSTLKIWLYLSEIGFNSKLYVLYS